MWTLGVRSIFTVATRLTLRHNITAPFPQKDIPSCRLDPRPRLLKRGPQGCRWVHGRMAGSGLGQPCLPQELERAVLDRASWRWVGPCLTENQQTLLRWMGERLGLQQLQAWGPVAFLRSVGPALRSMLVLIQVG